MPTLVTGVQVPWPQPPRDPGPWNGGPPISPPGNTPLPPLPGAGGVVHNPHAQPNPWTSPAAAAPQFIPPAHGAPGTPGAPPAAAPGALVDRAPIWILAVSAVIVVALIAGGVYVVLKGGRQYPKEWDARVAPITAWVAKERELDFKHPVKVNFLTDKEYTARSTEGADDPSAETKQYYKDQEAQLRALGFLEGSVDLAKANSTLSDSGTLAYYDPDVEQVFVRGTKLTPATRVTLAHELTHVLQDQHFDLKRLDSFDDGRGGVLRALGEGDATKVEEAYVADVLTAKERKAYEKESRQSGDDASKELDKSVPPILTTLFSAPYVLGPELISVLDEKDGWDAINKAIQEPPTEEVLLDPTMWQSPDAKPTTVDVAAPKGAEVIDEAEFGPTAWYLMLASRMDPTIALGATDGWGGDRYVVYRQAGKVCVSVTTKGDTPADVDQLSKAAGLWASKSPKGSAEAKVVDGTVRFRSCDPGTKAKAGGSVSTDLLTLPVTRTEVYLSGLKAKRTEEESRCYANGVITKFTYSQLSDPDGTFINSAAGQKVLTDLRDSCFG